MKLFTLLLFLVIPAFAQTPTTGSLEGSIKDQQLSVVPGATVKVTSLTTGETRSITSDTAGNFSAAFLPPGTYRVLIQAAGFSDFIVEMVPISIMQSTAIDAVLRVAGIMLDPVFVDTGGGRLVDRDNPTLGRHFDTRTIALLPLATHNLTQLIGLTAGASTLLVDSTVVGRNTSNVSVNGARLSQNNIQINGVDAAAATTYIVTLPLANPALESIAEVKIQTSLYDATFGRAGGGSIQVLTKSGSNSFSGVVYDHFGNTTLNATNPFLKAVGAGRPVLKRNIFGGAAGGPLKKDRAFFFASYQTTGERNGASRLNSLSVNVLVDPRLTDDRTEGTLLQTYNLAAINPTALRLLNARLPDGRFAIPTPQVNGRYIGSDISSFREEQFNSNFDYRFSQRNSLSAKLFFSNATGTLARSGAINVPGFGVDQTQNHRLLSIQDIHNFRSSTVNEARLGYNFVRSDNVPRQPLNDSDLGIVRSTASIAPGLPAISISQAAGGIQFGTGALQSSLSTASTITLGDMLSVTIGRHAYRFGGEIRSYRSDLRANILTRGMITFANFNSFLTGTTQTAQLGNGLSVRNLRATDYNFFIQDDWKLTSKLTINLGIRYELDLPPYDSLGRFSTFDPALYQYRQLIVGGIPAGPPIAGVVQAGNAIARYDLPDVPNVSKRILKSIDANNIAPRLGFAYSPFGSSRLVIRGGYGTYHSRTSFQSAGSTMFSPPFYFVSPTQGRNISDSFADVGLEDQFPRFVVGSSLFGNAVDRNNRTPYYHQYSFGVQLPLSKNTVLGMSYVGSRGMKLSRQIAINKARLSRLQDPIVNAVTGLPVPTNLPANASLRAPYQGVALGNQFLQDQTSGKSVYNSFQAHLDRHFSHRLQFLVTYTFSRSTDTNSGGGGSGTVGLLNFPANEINTVVGDQFDGRANSGRSDFDRTHRIVFTGTWDLPTPGFAAHRKAARALLSHWQVSAIMTGMSGLPVDIVDTGAATLYFGANAGGARPNYVSGISPMLDVPAGYYFNPYAFSRPLVSAGQVIPTSNGAAVAGLGCPLIQAVYCADSGNVGRNSLRGPRQSNTDISLRRIFRLTESRAINVGVEFFNIFNNVNFANPISNFNAVLQSGGAIDQDSGRILPGRAGDFGKIISTSNNPRIVELSIKFTF
jgi:hypothetical protein